MKKILIVEDEEAIAELEKDYLELSGYDVTIETDGRSGLNAALNDQFDLYILDIMLPEIDGFELCRKIRASRNAPIIMVSARKEDVDKVKGLGLGADDYITKPFSPSELVARVKAHLSRYETLTSASITKNDRILTIRGLKINKTSHQVFVNGDEKILTSKEYDLLLYMAEHPNKVFSRDDLFKAVWNEDQIGDIATVTVHIKKLREKIEINKDRPQYIQTVWGAGYRFKV